MLLAPALAAVLVLGGCGGNGARPGELNLAVQDYNAQRYTRAYERAEPLSRSPDAATRTEASYLAGLSSFRVGNLDDAERKFLVAAASTDGTLAARANAMLGVVRIDQHRYREGAALLEKAQPLLTGEDARQAARQLAYAHQHIGDTAASRQWLSKSTQTLDSHITDSESRDHQVSTDLFALQIGAFKSRQLAESAAAIAAREIDRLGLGPTRIIPSRDERGQLLYLVQFGSFPTRSSAASTRQRLGKLDYIVAPLAIPTTTSASRGL